MFSNHLYVALQAAREAGALIKERFGTRLEINQKDGGRDFVTEVDRQAQNVIAFILSGKFPEHLIIGEEDDELDSELGSLADLQPDQYAWVVDPLDGTSNYIRNIPNYSVSITLVQGQDLKVGVIYIPQNDEIFYAEPGKGAWRNGKPIHVADNPNVASSMLGAGVPVLDEKERQEMMKILSKVAPKCLSMRMSGSSSSSLAYVACGRFSALFESGMHPWDILAGALLVTEAGGKVSNFSGGDFLVTSSDILASNGQVHGELLEYLK
ncbi:MAG: inositol monophosphatase [Synergistaceae bacterium]|jgi:myo-inositol-1(or 4)-monophosphatase|nr:inositol monophosphatase [Synergistaceae bacterium]